MGGSWGNGADLAKQFIVEVIVLGAIVLGVRYVMKFNLLGCFLVVAGSTLLGAVSELMEQPEAFYRLNGYVILAVLAILLAWPLLAWLFPKPTARGVAC